jgi:hypothetical protein
VERRGGGRGARHRRASSCPRHGAYPEVAAGRAHAGRRPRASAPCAASLAIPMRCSCSGRPQRVSGTKSPQIYKLYYTDSYRYKQNRSNQGTSASRKEPPLGTGRKLASLSAGRSGEQGYSLTLSAHHQFNHRHGAQPQSNHLIGLYCLRPECSDYIAAATAAER